MLHIYTENFFWPERAKHLVKRLLNKGARGPEAVFLSLCRGLTAIGESYKVNEIPLSPIDIACVLSGKKTLVWALQKKKKGLIKKIVAGPNITMTPLDDNHLMSNPDIDGIVQPSQWVVDFWTSLNPNIAAKLKAWPAGVADKGVLKNSRGSVLVFRKDVPEKIFEEVTEMLSSKRLPYKVFSYSSEGNSFEHALKDTQFVVYLNTSESQGLALQEAWMADVPTLVWNRGFFAARGYRWESEKVSAPYLSDQAGMIFSEKENFETVLETFQSKLSSFTPRQYVMQNLTDEICARKYLEIIYPPKF